MELLFLLLIGNIAIPLIAAFIISSKVRKQLNDAGNKHAKVISIAAFIGCFALTFCATYWASSFVHFER
jgi:hypothetical protein